MTLYFTRDHEWIRLDDNIASVGITDHAQQQLGDIVFVEMPATGLQLKKGQEVAVVESVKAASDIFAPVSGTVVETNNELENNPALVNEDPESAAWFFKVQVEDRAELNDLMNREGYDDYLKTL